MMREIELTVHVGDDGILRLETPVDARHADLKVKITIEENEAIEDLSQWPPGYFEQTAGALADFPLERGDEGTFETREVLL